MVLGVLGYRVWDLEFQASQNPRVHGKDLGCRMALRMGAVALGLGSWVQGGRVGG